MEHHRKRRHEQMNEIDDLVCFVDEAMLPFGGRLFAGFSRGKSNEK